MSDDITEVGKFEPREYMGMFLMKMFHERPDLSGQQFLHIIGIYNVYSTDSPEIFYLIDDHNKHYFLAREED